LQCGLFAPLDGAGKVQIGPWTSRDAFAGIRALIAVSSVRSVHHALRGGLGLGAAVLPDDQRLRFEQSRIGIRTAIFETVATWIGDWPTSFREGVSAAKLTQRTFARVHLDGMLGAEVARLPLGNERRHRVYIPMLDNPVIRRLRRRTPGAYREMRAKLILSALRRPA